jgi:hypothetical protein
MESKGVTEIFTTPHYVTNIFLLFFLAKINLPVLTHHHDSNKKIIIILLRLRCILLHNRQTISLCPSDRMASISSTLTSTTSFTFVKSAAICPFRGALELYCPFCRYFPGCRKTHRREKYEPMHRNAACTGRIMKYSGRRKEENEWREKNEKSRPHKPCNLSNADMTANCF